MYPTTLGAFLLTWLLLIRVPLVTFVPSPVSSAFHVGFILLCVITFDQSAATMAYYTTAVYATFSNSAKSPIIFFPFIFGKVS